MYVAAGHALRAFDLESGRKVWETGPLRNRDEISAGRVLGDGNGRLVNDVNVVRAFSKETGRIQWARYSLWSTPESAIVFDRCAHWKAKVFGHLAR